MYNYHVKINVKANKHLYNKIISFILSISIVGSAVLPSFAQYYMLAVPGAKGHTSSLVELDLNDKSESGLIDNNSSFNDNHADQTMPINGTILTKKHKKLLGKPHLRHRVVKLIWPFLLSVVFFFSSENLLSGQELNIHRPPDLKKQSLKQDVNEPALSGEKEFMNEQSWEYYLAAHLAEGKFIINMGGEIIADFESNKREYAYSNFSLAFDMYPQQVEIATSGRPLQLENGCLIYHGGPNLDQVLLNNQVDGEMLCTRFVHRWGTGVFNASFKSPAIYVIETDVFNRLVSEGKAELLVKLELNLFADPYPKIKDGLSLDDIKEIWVTQGDYERYKRIISAQDSSTLAAHEQSLLPAKKLIKQLIENGKLKAIPGLVRSNIQKEDDKDTIIEQTWEKNFFALGDYLKTNLLLEKVPYLIVEGEDNPFKDVDKKQVIKKHFMKHEIPYTQDEPEKQLTEKDLLLLHPEFKKVRMNEQSWQYYIPAAFFKSEFRIILTTAGIALRMEEFTHVLPFYYIGNHFSGHPLQQKIVETIEKNKMDNNLEFEQGCLLYHGRANLDYVLLNNAIDGEILCTQYPHLLAIGPFISNMENPAIFMVKTDVFNQLVAEDKAELQIVPAGGMTVDAFPIIKNGLSLENIEEIWVTSDDYVRYVRIATAKKYSDLTEDEQKLFPVKALIRQLIEDGKLLEVEGLIIHDGFVVKSDKDPNDAKIDIKIRVKRDLENTYRIGSFMLERGLFEKTPFLKIKGQKNPFIKVNKKRFVKKAFEDPNSTWNLICFNARFFVLYLLFVSILWSPISVFAWVLNKKYFSDFQEKGLFRKKVSVSHIEWHKKKSENKWLAELHWQSKHKFLLVPNIMSGLLVPLFIVLHGKTVSDLIIINYIFLIFTSFGGFLVPFTITQIIIRFISMFKYRWLSKTLPPHLFVQYPHNIFIDRKSYKEKLEILNKVDPEHRLIKELLIESKKAGNDPVLIFEQIVENLQKFLEKKNEKEDIQEAQKHYIEILHSL